MGFINQLITGGHHPVGGFPNTIDSPVKNDQFWQWRGLLGPPSSAKAPAARHGSRTCASRAPPFGAARPESTTTISSSGLPGKCWLIICYYSKRWRGAALRQLVFFGAFCSLRPVLFCSCTIISERCKILLCKRKVKTLTFPDKLI